MTTTTASPTEPARTAWAACARKSEALETSGCSQARTWGFEAAACPAPSLAALTTGPIWVARLTTVRTTTTVVMTTDATVTVPAAPVGLQPRARSRR